MKRLLLIAITAIAFTGCTKDDKNTGTSGGSDMGTIQFINNSNNPYRVYLNNNEIAEQKGNTSFSKSVSTGFYKVTVSQVSGYLVYPTVKNYEFNVAKGANEIVSYP